MTAYTYDLLERNGRLGNQLWQISWMYGQMKKRRKQRRKGSMHIRSDWKYRAFFSLPDEYFQEVTDSEVVDGGDLYYQELHHWAGYEDDIHKMFQPSELAKQELEKTFGFWLTQMREHGCAIHYRRGDYLQHPNHFPQPTEKFLEEAIHRASQVDPDVVFFVFSDDISNVELEWRNSDSSLKQFLISQHKVLFMKGVPPTPVEVIDRPAVPRDWLDMFAIAECKQHIISNSTFAWWGAFLSESRHAFYPSVWWGPAIDARDTRGLDVRESWVDAMPSNWSRIEC